MQSNNLAGQLTRLRTQSAQNSAWTTDNILTCTQQTHRISANNNINYDIVYIMRSIGITTHNADIKLI